MGSARQFFCSVCWQVRLPSSRGQAGLQSKMAHSYVARSAVRDVDWSPWVLLQVVSPCHVGFSWDCRKYQSTASLIPHSVAKTCQDQLSLRGREKTLFLHELLYYSNPSHLWREKQTKGFIVGALILLLFIKKFPSVDSIPTRCRETESLLLDLLQGKNRVRISHSDGVLTSRGLGATWAI